MHFEQEIARGTAIETRIALPRQPDLLARLDAGRDADLERPVAAAVTQRDALAAAVIRRFERNRDLRMQIAAAMRSACGSRAACAAVAVV